MSSLVSPCYIPSQPGLRPSSNMCLSAHKGRSVRWPRRKLTGWSISSARPTSPLPGSTNYPHTNAVIITSVHGIPVQPRALSFLVTLSARCLGIIMQVAENVHAVESRYRYAQIYPLGMYGYQFQGRAFCRGWPIPGGKNQYTEPLETLIGGDSRMGAWSSSVSHCVHLVMLDARSQ